MKISVDLRGKERKELTRAVGEIVGSAPIYMRAPSYAYQVGWLSIDRDGALVSGEDVDSAAMRDLLERLAEQGFVPEEYDFGADAGGEADPEACAPAPDALVDDSRGDEPVDRLVIELPLKGFSGAALDNLEKLVASKAALIRKAVCADSLEIHQKDGLLRFSWFSLASSTEEFRAYTQLVRRSGRNGENATADRGAGAVCG